MMRAMDLLVRGATVLTLDPRRRVLPGADLLVQDGRIAAIGKVPRPAGAVEVVEAAGHLLLPGFVQAHVHLCQTLFRNLGGERPLLRWLRERIWPLEAALDEDAVHAAARLGIAELLLGGTTAALDMGTVAHTGAIFAAAEAAGFRLTSGKAHMDAGEGVPRALRERTAASLTEGEALCRTWNGKGLLRYAFAPRFVLSSSDRLLEEIAPRARALGARLHSHAAENRDEEAAVRARFGAPAIEILHRSGITGEDVALAHCVWPSRRAIGILSRTRTSVVHCPSSNLKLGSGIAPLPELLDAGVRVALGADGAACNDDLDAFTELRLASLLHRPRRFLPPAELLALATIGGARALGREREIGSLEVGKRADLVLVGMAGLHATAGGGDPHALVAHVLQRADVRGVWVDGVCRVRDGELRDADAGEIREHAAAALRRVLRGRKMP
jgi:5-methylthioadenosine/S-adenosylhomocysteine deaminase